MHPGPPSHLTRWGPRRVGRCRSRTASWRRREAQFGNRRQDLRWAMRVQLFDLISVRRAAARLDPWLPKQGS